MPLSLCVDDRGDVACIALANSHASVDAAMSCTYCVQGPQTQAYQHISCSRVSQHLNLYGGQRCSIPSQIFAAGGNFAKLSSCRYLGEMSSKSNPRRRSGALPRHFGAHRATGIQRQPCSDLESPNLDGLSNYIHTTSYLNTRLLGAKATWHP
jgi:hypothetical protein